MVYPDNWRVRRDYTARGQLKAIGQVDGNGNWTVSLSQYTYLADGKLDRQDYYNGVQSQYGYDARGMMSSVRHYWLSTNQTYTQRAYWRDSRDRITAWAKGTDTTLNSMEDGRGDHYWYDSEGQLTNAYYQAANPNSSPSNPQRTDTFSYDALGNRQQSNQLAARGSTRHRTEAQVKATIEHERDIHGGISRSFDRENQKREFPTEYPTKKAAGDAARDQLQRDFEKAQQHDERFRDVMKRESFR